MVSLVYLAAGVSSRFNNQIKGLVKVRGEESLVEVSLNQALKAGFDRIIFIVSSKTIESFKEKFGSRFQNIPVYYALQEFNEEKRDKPWGTAEALCSVIPFINSGLVVANTDDLYGGPAFKLLVDSVAKGDNAAIGFKLKNTLSELGEVNRGIIHSEDSIIKEIKETFGINSENLKEKWIDEGDLCAVNFFGFQRETLDLIAYKVKEFKEKNSCDRKIEAILPVFLNELISQGKIKLKVYSCDDKFLGITNPGDELRVREALAGKIL